jgi:aminopeptidase 2
VLYSPERLVKIAEEAAKGETVFSADDRIGLVNDASALAKAGFSDTSAVLSVANTLRHEHDRKSSYLISAT